MLFTSFSFVFIFLPITLSAYYAARNTRHALIVIIVASLFFYGVWDYRLVPVLAAAIGINYLIALRIERTSGKGWFLFGVALALVPLIYFKYSGFFANNLGLPYETGLFGERLGSLLPLGISFYTFQQIAYLSDVRQGKIKPGGFVEYAFFKLFFPQLIAGPIVHYTEIVPQIGRPIDRERMFLVGVVFFVIGFVKKFFVADGFAAFSDPIFDSTDPVTTQQAIIAMMGYTFQIYFDFSGYSDMALGLARMFGFELPLNFNSPYKARSISDFWRRWHMTLSRFLRDYVYIPMGGNRRGGVLQYRNLLFTMLVGGLWHGAAWTFVVWGGLHGLALAVNHLWNRYVRIPLFGLGWPLTFIFAALCWVLFRATSFERAMEIYSALLAFEPLETHQFWWWLAGGIAATALLPNSQEIAGWVWRHLRVPEFFSVTGFCRPLAIYAVLSSVVLYGVAALYYNSTIDRRVYAAINAPSFWSGMSNRDGDFRNNLWAKEATHFEGRSIALVGSSFVGSAGNYTLTNTEAALSQTFGMGGNGILNGARQADALIRSRVVDVVFLGVSPLNFGNAIPYAPFEGQCTDALVRAARDKGFVLKVEDAGSSCFPDDKFKAIDYFGVFSDSRATLYQFRNFIHNALKYSFSMEKRENFKDLPIDVASVAADLQGVKNWFESFPSDPNFAPDQNGSDAKFKWRDRKIIDSLQPSGAGFAIIKYLSDIAKENEVELVVYETPTPKNHLALYVYPNGFFEDYNGAMRQALAETGLQYLDLSDLLPWQSAFFGDFIHPTAPARAVVHRVLLAWLYHPQTLMESGLLSPGAIPERHER